MTTNQIAYHKLQEEKRANRVNEKERHEYNKAQVKLGVIDSKRRLANDITNLVQGQLDRTNSQVSDFIGSILS